MVTPTLTTKQLINYLRCYDLRTWLILTNDVTPLCKVVSKKGFFMQQQATSKEIWWINDYLQMKFFSKHRMKYPSSSELNSFLKVVWFFENIFWCALFGYLPFLSFLCLMNQDLVQESILAWLWNYQTSFEPTIFF